MSKDRMEAFSDGVLAIIITIMVLGLREPAGDKLGDILKLWPDITAYAVSFLFIAIYWVNHHIMFRKTETVNLKILWCNIAWLFVMSFIPFTTSWVGAHLSSPVPLAVYFLTKLAVSLVFLLMYYLVTKERGEQFRLSRGSIAVLVSYVAAAAIGGLCPPASFILVVCVTCWWMAAKRKKVI